MHQIYAEYSASISELKRNPGAVLEEAGEAPIAILSHNKPVAYLIPSLAYEILLEQLEDKLLIDISLTRETEFDKAIEVNLGEI